ncbi:MAG: MotA/TolQ/ExbB proton channel family protein [Elusimicrobia bacterium]|nr:MotA/TolQ/ExbB proton channel family protein [Elusimicrobiota bacterium]
MTDINYLEILRSSFTLVILIFCSILSITFAVERWLFFRKIDPNPGPFLAKVKQLMEEGRFKEVLEVCEKTTGPVSALVKTAVTNRQKEEAEMDRLLGAARLDERLKMERFLAILGTLGNTAPFIGLFGTVVGIIKAFRDLALAGAGGPAIVAKGIAEALVATAAGLAVAIPAVIIYNYFTKRVKAVSSVMEAASLRITTYLKP